MIVSNHARTLLFFFVEVCGRTTNRATSATLSAWWGFKGDFVMTQQQSIPILVGINFRAEVGSQIRARMENPPYESRISAGSAACIVRDQRENVIVAGADELLDRVAPAVVETFRIEGVGRVVQEPIELRRRIVRPV
jgi:hypothetical protein